MTYDINDETYSSAQVFVQYIPTNRSEPIPVIGSLRDPNIPYYDVYSFNTIVTMLNNCLNEAFARLVLDTGFSGLTYLHKIALILNGITTHKNLS